MTTPKSVIWHLNQIWDRNQILYIIAEAINNFYLLGGTTEELFNELKRHNDTWWLEDIKHYKENKTQ